MFGTPLGVVSARTMSSAPTDGITAANRSGRSVIARPTRMPPALPPQIARRAGFVQPCATRYSAQAMKSFQVLGFVACRPASCHCRPNTLLPRGLATANTPPASIHARRL